jgi:hypothetical protein
MADHRIQLFCELSLFHEEEENLLIIAKVPVCFSLAVLRIRNWEFGAFLTPESGMGKKSGSGIRIRDEQPGSYKKHFFC